MRTSELYERLWASPYLSRYVAAIGPALILRRITFTGSDMAYIINVTLTGSGERESAEKRKGDSPEGLQGSQGFGGPVDLLPSAVEAVETVEAVEAVDTVGSLRGVSESKGDRRRRRSCRDVGRRIGHWIVLVDGGEGCEIFDSLGSEGVSRYGEEEMKLFVKMRNCHLVNDVLLSSKDCGYFCLLFCYYKCMGLTSRQVVTELKRCKLNIREVCANVL